MRGTALLDRIFTSRALGTALIAMGVWLALALLRSAGMLQPLELWLYDHLVRAQAAGRTGDSRIALIGATDVEIARFGWPLRDGLLADALERIGLDRPRVIGVDIYRDIPIGDGGDRLAAVLEKDASIVFVSKLPDGLSPGIDPPAVLRGTDRVGLADVPLDADGVTRKSLLFAGDAKGQTHLGFPLRLALKYLAPLGIAPAAADDPSLVQLGRSVLRPFGSSDGGYVDADASGYQLLLGFPAGYPIGPIVALEEVIDGRIAPGTFKDRIVILGVTSQSVKDTFLTPLSDAARPGMFGIELHAHVVSQMLGMAMDGKHGVSVFPDWVEHAANAAVSIAAAIAGHYAVTAPRLAMVAGTGAATLYALARLMFVSGWWMPAAQPVIAWLAVSGLVSAYLGGLERRERGQLMHLFSRYVPAQVAQEIWLRRRELIEGTGIPRSQRLTATVLFSDIRGFTTISEQLGAPALMGWLGTYTDEMTQLVMKHGGIVDKFIGDAVMAVFGVPLPRGSRDEIAKDARQAVRCALAMERALARLNRQFAAAGLPPVGIRIGIHTGELIAGSLGSRDRLEYTVIGDTVNVASRLESFDRSLVAPDGEDCRILISEQVLALLGGDYPAERIGSFRLKGKGEPTVVYRIFARAGRGDVQGESS